MAQSLEGTIQSLLQGVSQQVPRERQPGQLGEQLNMLSDPVSGIRRRPPAETRINPGIPSFNLDSMFVEYVERGTDGRHLLINTDTGNWWLLSKDTQVTVNSGQDDYFKASLGQTSLQTTSIAGLTYILNTEKAPSITRDNGDKIDPATTGFFYVKTSAFQKRWTVTVTTGGVDYTAFYNAPAAGTTAGNAEEVSAAYVIEQLRLELINQGFPAENVSTRGAYMFFFGMTNCVVGTDAGDTYAIVSNQSKVTLESDLPAQLPAAADGAMCQVGQASSEAAWYKYDFASRTWSETGAYGSISSIGNMPRELAADDQILVREWEGRLSGNDDNNEDPGFVVNGYITGIAAFQGRLVLLSGSTVDMSASGLFQRMYRSTVTSLLDTDRISISSASAQDSVYRTAIQFNRDLVIFANSMQAVIPGSAVLTPTNASISITSTFECDSRVMPTMAGQTVIYPSRRNSSYASILELIPSPYTSSQYTTVDSTVHLPRYIPGRVMQMQTSSVTNMAFMRYTGQRNALLVYEFMWGGGDGAKVQSAWHQWTLPYPILGVQALEDLVYVYMQGPGNALLVAAMDPREGYTLGQEYDTAYSDFPTTVTVSGGQFTVPSIFRYTNYHLSIKEELILTYPQGTAMAATEVGLNEFLGANIVSVVRGVPDGTYVLGRRYKSAMTLTTPTLRDRNDKLVGSGHVRLLRLDVALRNSGHFDVHVTDTPRDVDWSGELSGVLMNSKELVLGRTLRVDLAVVTVPCRTNADTTEIQFSTNGSQELNILDISYILRYNQRRQRV
ncbi:tail protein [Klebsiella phage vB_Kpl_K72PH164C2]|uniref:Tail protein n=1 Tax=Klebsiella phage vB_Kpl_K72PH164C2 TaxID=3071646 RepID=A0AAD2GS61_9CAUD|nr:tail protein [Klebsiella phage vB_Kpl_K72PH164C2]